MSRAAMFAAGAVGAAVGTADCASAYPGYGGVAPPVNDDSGSIQPVGDAMTPDASDAASLKD